MLKFNLFLNLRNALLIITYYNLLASGCATRMSQYHWCSVHQLRQWPRVLAFSSWLPSCARF